MDNTESTEQPVTKPTIATGGMNTPESFPAASTLAVRSEQPVPVVEVERDDLTAFFAVGVVVNIVMITAYFFWAYKQWKKSGTSSE